MKTMNRRKMKIYLFCFIMTLPALYGIFRYIWSNGYSIVISFYEGDPFVGTPTLYNFERLFRELKGGNQIGLALVNTLKCFGVGLLKLCMSYVIAYFLYKKITGHKQFTFLFFLPSIIAPVISTYIFREIIKGNGLICQLLGYPEGYPAFLSMPDTAMNTILLFDLLTGLGANFLIIMGAMNRIPEEYIEAAKMDGCNQWTEFWKIIFPLVWENFSTLLILQLTGIFTASGPILYFTGGDADTNTLAFWIFGQVKGLAGDPQYNYPAAVGLFFTILAIPIVFGVRAIAKKINPEVSY